VGVDGSVKVFASEPRTCSVSTPRPYSASVRVFVVRHGCAGDKRRWRRPDAERPLDAAGVRQAGALAETLAGVGVRRIATSPTRRCRDTVMPLARRLGLPVDEVASLGPSPAGDALLALMTADDACDAVLCTHGENMRPALAALRAGGVPIDSPHDDQLLAKGAGWAVTVDESGAIVRLGRVVPDFLISCSAHGAEG
jgi:8-oxo-dGTP diphosphatase